MHPLYHAWVNGAALRAGQSGVAQQEWYLNSFQCRIGCALVFHSPLPPRPAPAARHATLRIGRLLRQGLFVGIGNDKMIAPALHPRAPRGSGCPLAPPGPARGHHRHAFGDPVRCLTSSSSCSKIGISWQGLRSLTADTVFFAGLLRNLSMCAGRALRHALAHPVVVIGRRPRRRVECLTKHLKARVHGHPITTPRPPPTRSNPNPPPPMCRLILPVPLSNIGRNGTYVDYAIPRRHKGESVKEKETLGQSVPRFVLSLVRGRVWREREGSSSCMVETACFVA